MQHITISSNYDENFQFHCDKDDFSRTFIATFQSIYTKTDYDATKAAFDHKQIAELSCGTKIDFSKNASLLERATWLLSEAYKHGRASYNDASSIFVNACCKAWKVNLDHGSLDQVLSSLNLDADSRQRLKSRIDYNIARREAECRLLHSLSRRPSRSVGSYDGICSDIEKLGLGKIIVLNGKLGSGKTCAQRELYMRFRQKGLHPMYVCSKRTICASFGKEEPIANAAKGDHYRDYLEGNVRQGVYGVINTLMSGGFEEARFQTKALLIDEIQDLMDHLAGGTIGATWGDRIRATEELGRLIAKCPYVIVADAFITDDCIEWLAEVSGKAIEIFTCGRQPEFEVQIVKNPELLERAIQDAGLGRKVAIFCDYNHKEFQTVVNTMRGALPDKNIQEITSEAVKKMGGDKLLVNLDQHLKKADVAVISPLLNAGVSVTLPDYERVYCLSGCTLSPTMLLQSLRRFRCAREAVVAFKYSRSSRRPMEGLAVIYEDVRLTNTKTPLLDAGEYYKTATGKFLADYRGRRNRQFFEFRQTFTIIAEQQGFAVRGIESDSQLIRRGRKAGRLGRRITEEMIREIAFNVASSGKSLRELPNNPEEGESFQDTIERRTLIAMWLMGKSHLDEEVYRQIFGLEIDRVISTRRYIQAACDKVVDAKSLKAYAAQQFLTTAGVNLQDLAKSRVSKARAEDACEMLLDPVMTAGKDMIAFKDIVEKVFWSVNFKKTYKTQIVRDCLRAMGFDLARAGAAKNKQREYTVVNLVVGRDDITEIADTYCPFKVTKLVGPASIPGPSKGEHFVRYADRKAWLSRISKDQEEKPLEQS